MTTQRRGLVTPQVEQFYRHLLRSATATVQEHAEIVGWPTARADRALQELQELGLVAVAQDGTVVADDPRATVGRLLDAEETALDARRLELLGLRRSLQSLELDYRRGLQASGPRLPLVEQVPASSAADSVEHLFRVSRGDILQVTREVQLGPGHDESVRRQFAEVASAGRVICTIFPRSALEDPQWPAFAEPRAEAGERQRYLPDDAIRVQFGVWGRDGVLLDDGTGPDGDYLLVRAAPCVDVFIALFGELWRRAEPVVSGAASAQDVKLLELLALGFKDEALARQLGLSLRTVRRRVASLMEEHGVETRFQLGMAVGSRGLLEGHRR